MLQLKVFKDEAGFDVLRPQWNSLLACSSANTLFQSLTCRSVRLTLPAQTSALEYGSGSRAIEASLVSYPALSVGDRQVKSGIPRRI